MSSEIGKGNGIPHDIPFFIGLLVIYSIIAASVAYVCLTPRPAERLFALGVSGDYSAGESLRVVPGEQIDLYVAVSNHMGSVQYVMIRAKLLNDSMPSPDFVGNATEPLPYFTNETAPSPEAPKYRPSLVLPFEEFTCVLVDNGTWVLPFQWSVEGVSRSGYTVGITALKLNNITIANGLSATAKHGFNFRIVLELWTYANQTAGWQYGWRSGNEDRSAWTQIRFDLVLPQAGMNQTTRVVVENP
jgi:hypothetical protein